MTGAQYVAVVNSAAQVGLSIADYAAEAERTRQIKAQSLRDMHVSNNDVQIAHYKLTERKDELNVERIKLENARQAADDSHKRWVMNHESREETAKILREKLRQGTITEQELLILQSLCIPASESNGGQTE
ncbi:hypothetical protein [Citrobacter sp. BDA59-3]|uniref:hypothetical protein n=1 Tax=Citrobacter sp. BDA59-3 TaxID=2781952 RepID=UPI0018806AC6|nr:hypothetical protein [Citrobacter sp. BDA59-3]QOV66587.1 hypothetical protein IP582_12835 [Citrobacter sp. BDA59-3]